MPLERKGKKTDKDNLGEQIEEDEKTYRVDAEEKLGESFEEQFEENDEEAYRTDIALDEIGAKYMQMERSVCFLDNTIFTLEVSVSEHKRPEVKEVKIKEIKKLEDYDTFELV